jgi:hypothetical protein
MGVNLYNNGFSGGLVAIVLYPTITAVARRRNPDLQQRDEARIFQEDSPEPTERDQPPDPEREPGPPRNLFESRTALDARIRGVLNSRAFGAPAAPPGRCGRRSRAPPGRR